MLLNNEPNLQLHLFLFAVFVALGKNYYVMYSEHGIIAEVISRELLMREIFLKCKTVGYEICQAQVYEAI